MELTILGAGPAYTDRHGAAGASYLLRDGRGAGAGLAANAPAALLLDLGHGAFANLAGALEPSELTAILVSHLHPDHFIDLVPLRHYLKWQFDPPRRVAVAGPDGLMDRLDAVNGHSGFAAAALDIAHLEEGARRFGRFDVEVRRVTHDAESFAMRVLPADSAGPGLVYSGDCGRADDLLPLIRPGDTLLCEASFGAGVVPVGAGHMTAADAGRVAAAGGAARLLLTHIQMGYSRADALAAAQAVFSGPVQLVTEGDRFEV
jgi:ribonuclease BN (tRNA processing enzyme)